jgi:N-methylhydantoinase B
MNLLNLGGFDPRDGSYYNYIETYAGGQGAFHNQDGMDAVQNHMTNTRNAPVEAIEAAYPLRVLRYGFVADSDGAGRFRGGVGLLREVEILGTYTRLTLSSDRKAVHPWGAFGGSEAAGSRCAVTRSDGTTIDLPSKVTTFLQQGDRLLTVTPGGGGWGDPRERDPERVRKDVQANLITPVRAREVYGVAIEDD